MNLYWTSPYETKFQAEITHNTLEGIILNVSLFFPQGGGQSSDKGTIIHGENQYEVFHVSRSEDGLLHHIKEDHSRLAPGEIIEAQINWENRYELMKAHTSQHLLSSLLSKQLNCNTGSVRIDPGDVTLNLDKSITLEELNQVLIETNKLSTSQGLDVNQDIITRETALKMVDELRDNFIPEEDDVRIVKIESRDQICCGGTHVKHTSEIGPLFVYDFNGEEIKYYVGEKAIEHFNDANINILELSNVLNCTIKKIHSLTKKKFDQADQLQLENDLIKKDLLNLISAQPKLQKANYTIFECKYNIDKDVLNKGFDEFPENSILILNPSNPRIIILSNSEAISAQNLIKQMIETYGGKGGGSPRFAQAIIEKKPDEMVKEIAKLL